MYQYRATIVRVIDGDTVEADVQLGFHVSLRAMFRLSGINTPEVRGPERPLGLAAKAYLQVLLNDLTDGSRELLIKTKKDKTGKYGRYLAELWVGEVNLNQTLVESGHAERTHY